MGKIIDLTGKTFTRLTVTKAIPGSRKKKRSWFCRCNCGKTTTASTNDLLKGHTKSCGCLRNMVYSIKHGQASREHTTPEYNAWCGINYRCNNPKSAKYSYYGGRGIKVCTRWKSFENFYQDMGKRPSRFHSIDRYPDKSGDYSPENCRWATRKEQNNNRSNNIFLTWNSETKSLLEWSSFWNIPYIQLYKLIQPKLYIVKEQE